MAGPTLDARPRLYRIRHSEHHHTAISGVSIDVRLRHCLALHRRHYSFNLHIGIRGTPATLRLGSEYLIFLVHCPVNTSLPGLAGYTVMSKRKLMQLVTERWSTAGTTAHADHLGSAAARRYAASLAHFAIMASRIQCLTDVAFLNTQSVRIEQNAVAGWRCCVRSEWSSPTIRKAK